MRVVLAGLLLFLVSCSQGTKTVVVEQEQERHAGLHILHPLFIGFGTSVGEIAVRSPPTCLVESAGFVRLRSYFDEFGFRRTEPILLEPMDILITYHTEVPSSGPAPSNTVRIDREMLCAVIPQAQPTALFAEIWVSGPDPAASP